MIVRFFKEENAVTPERKDRKIRDYCFDVVATSIEEVAPNVYAYGTGLHFVIQDYAHNDMIDECITVRPRSSIWKTGMVLSNSIGTVDKGYRGEVKLVFYHVMPNMPKYEVGDKIGQIHLDIAPIMSLLEIGKEHFENLIKNEIEEDENCRNTEGYGSTGK